MTYKFGIPSTPAGTVTDVGGVQSTDASTGVVFSVTLNTAGTNTLENPTNLQEGQKYTWQLKQDAVTPVAVTFGADFLFAGGTPPGATQDAGAVDILRATALDTGSGIKLYCEFEADVRMPTPIVAEDNIQHWWKMNTGNTTGTDEGKTGVTQRDLTFTSVTTVTNGNRTGTENVNDFDGVGADGMTAAGAETTTVMSTVSYSFWIKPSDTPSVWETLFMCMQSGGWTRGTGCSYNSGDLIFWAGDGTPSPYVNTYSSAAYPATGSWAHVACVLDYGSGIRKIYVNGTEGTKTGGDVDPSFTGSNYVFSVGAASHATGNAGWYWHGELSDFRIYDIALSAGQVASIYAGDWP